jgi:hypothetical protein
MDAGAVVFKETAHAGWKNKTGYFAGQANARTGKNPVPSNT